jgi:hypothetical protein
MLGEIEFDDDTEHKNQLEEQQLNLNAECRILIANCFPGLIVVLSQNVVL